MIKTAHQNIAHQVASYLLEIGAIKLSPHKPFTWASGIKSPIYCDNRLSLSFPSIRTYIKEALKQEVQTQYPEVEAIAGVATAGIPQAALLADALNLPLIYVRSSPKGHGMENMIEGQIVEGRKIVVVEDLVSTGGSSLKAVEAIRASGMHVMGMLAIFTYGFELAEENFKQADVSLSCLSDYRHMLQIALKEGKIDEQELNTLNDWRTKPNEWGK